MEYMQSLLSVENLISGLAGVIISLVTYKFGFLGKKDMDVAEREAIECVQEMDQVLKKHHYERTMAYNIFYAAYLNMKLNNMGMAREMMARFHDTGVDIRHYTLGVQRLYDEVVAALA